MDDPTNENLWAHQASINNDTINSLIALDKRLREVERRMPEDHIDRVGSRAPSACAGAQTCIESP